MNSQCSCLEPFYIVLFQKLFLLEILDAVGFLILYMRVANCNILLFSFLSGILYG